MSAQAKLPVSYDLVGIAKAAGSAAVSGVIRYEIDTLIVDDVTQAALDAAVAAYNDAAYHAQLSAPIALGQKVAAGFSITSTSGNWTETLALDEVTLDQIGALARGCASGMGLPEGAATFSYPDINGQPGPALTPQNMIDVYKALRDYVAGITQQAAVIAQGGTPSWPSATKTIA